MTADITVTQGNDQFYPTPQALASKMLAKVEWNYVYTVLEPSAGKGNLVECAANVRREYHSAREFHVDCIEIDPYLRQILKYNFSAERIRDIRAEYRHINEKYYEDVTPSERAFMKQKKTRPTDWRM